MSRECRRGASGGGPADIDLAAARREDPEGDALGFLAANDGEEVPGGSGQVIRLTDNQRVPSRTNSKAASRQALRVTMRACRHLRTGQWTWIHS